jgi:demethylspheroidene O-methyltransferase
MAPSGAVTPSRSAARSDLPPRGGREGSAPPSAGRGWADRFYAWRNSLIRSPRFQRWAATFPLTRPVARRKASQLFDLVAGFVYSQALFACVETGLLEAVENGPLALDAIARRTGLPPDGARRLCAAAATLGLMREAGSGRYGLGDLGAALLGNPGIGAMVRHHALLYRDLGDPVALLRGERDSTELSRFWAYAEAARPGELDAGAVAEYSRLMAVSQGFIADEVLDACPLAGHRVVMDVGGGEGAFIRAAAARGPRPDFILFDLPAVAARAEAAFQAAGLGARARAVGGDLFADALPKGADAATLIRVLYDHPRERALAILRAVRAALPEGGTLLVAEPMAGTTGAEAMGAVYFSFYLLAMKGGDSRSAADLVALIREAGFSAANPVATRRPLFTSLIQARA